jgi:hypothetical protein
MKNLRFAVAAVLALSASSAFAGTLTTPTPASGTASDMFLVVVNTANGKSEVVDLGVGATALTNGQTFNVADPVATLGATTATLQYLVVGGDTSFSANNLLNFDGNILYTTSTNAGTLTWTGTAVNGGLNGLNTWFTNAFGGGASTWAAAGTGNYNSFTSGGTSTTGNWGPVNSLATMPGYNLSLTGLVANAAIGTAINLFSVTTTQTGADAGTDAATATKLGTFTLSGSTLTFSNVVSSVPLPAALWLLASGVFGLGAAGRRRKIAA